MISRAPLLVLLTLVALTAVAVPACGGSSPPTLAEYQEAVVTTRNRVDFALARITKAKSRDDFLERMDEASSAIGDAAGDFDDVGAPEGFKDETELLVGSLKQLAVDLSALATDIRNDTLGELPVGARGVNFESWDKANLALTRLVGQGIEVELLERH